MLGDARAGRPRTNDATAARLAVPDRRSAEHDHRAELGRYRVVSTLDPATGRHRAQRLTWSWVLLAEVDAALANLIALEACCPCSPSASGLRARAWSNAACVP